MLETNEIAVVVPCYQETQNIVAALERIPDLVDRIYVIDDACPDNTGELVKSAVTDSRVCVIRHDINTGVGGAMVTGYRQALEDGMDIVIKIDGDGQMDTDLIPRFVRPILTGKADYTKGNRFFTLRFLSPMPTKRIFGNAILSFFNKLSTGYWSIFDPNNGYTAIHAKVLAELPLEKLHKGYFFESDMLYLLATTRAVVLDIPQNAIYGNEKSHLKVRKVAPTFFLKHIRNFFARIFYLYFLRDFHLASIQWLLGPGLLIFGVIFGISAWTQNIEMQTEASAGTVMLSALPTIVGMQMLLSALGFDIDNQPRVPVHIRL